MDDVSLHLLARWREGDQQAAAALYERIAPAVIQPAGLFLDVIGESLRARTYVFTDPDGAELSAAATGLQQPSPRE